jgi:hypothetical protein
VRFFDAPGLNFDFASFSFQVPICGFWAKQTVALANNAAKVSRITLPFIYLLLIELQNYKTDWCGRILVPRWPIRQLRSRVYSKVVVDLEAFLFDSQRADHEV